MQSGISASQELVSQFKILLSSDTYFGLIASIKAEKLEPIALLGPSSLSFAENVNELLTPHVLPDTAMYVLLRRFDSAPFLTAVTYVPDTSPVRQKMLVASTRLTLVRELGWEHFRDTLFATAPEELSPTGFSRHDAHVKMDAPLTQEERSLGEVKRAEQEAGSGTGAREIHLSKHFQMPLVENALAAVKELTIKDSGKNLVMLKVNPDIEVVELVPSSLTPSSIPELVSAISSTEPRFTFFRFTHTHAGTAFSSVLFFYTCPVTSGNRAIKSRMLYPLMKRFVLETVKQAAGLEVDKKFEVEEPAEITEALVFGELHPKAQECKGFSRPKKPGR